MINKSMGRNKKYESDTTCDGIVKKKIHSRHGEQSKGLENMSRKIKNKRKTEDEEVAIPIKKSKKRTKNSELMEKKSKRKSKKHQAEDEVEVEKERKKRHTKEHLELDVTEAVSEEEEEEEEEEEVDLGPEERRVLERKMKKLRKQEEKMRLKAEGKTVEKTEASKPTAAQQALDYLTCWSENREDWRFQKTRQTWLLQHMFDTEKISDESFSVLLSYLEGLRGAARDTTVQKAEKLVREREGEEEEESETQQSTHRAREVIQLLS